MTEARFEGDAVFRALSGDELARRFGSRRTQIYELVNSVSFTSVILAEKLVVPAGFCSDFASVPKGLRGVVDNDDPGVILPSIFHDWLYRNRGDVPGGPFSRKEADDVMLEGMKALGLPILKRRAVYFAIRVGGRFTWKD